MAVETGEYVPGSIWFYAPNKGAAIFFSVAFMVSLICHVWQSHKYQSWRLTGIYVFASCCFTGGFIARVIGAYDYGHLVKFIVSIVLVYSAPPLYELANYNILGRCLYYIPYHSPIHPGRVITTFAFISAIVEILNGNGVSLTANQEAPRHRQEIGHNLLKAALLIQCAVIACFVWLALTFQRRFHAAGVRCPSVDSVLLTLYISSGLLASRTIFRTVEYFAISDFHYTPGMDPKSLSPLVRYESFFYVFDALLMLANQAMINVRHPRMWLPKSTKTYLSRADSKTELTGPGYNAHDKRNFFVTLVDPFDLASLFSKRDGKTKKFWEDDGVAANGVVVAPETNGEGDSKKKMEKSDGPDAV